MGAEALSRGAREVVGIENHGRACGIIKENWSQIAQQEQKFTVLRGDVVIKLKSLAGEKFDCIYFDPPYESNLYQPVLETIASLQLLAESGEIAVEHDRKYWQAQVIPGLQICREKSYGNTALTFYQLVEKVLGVRG